MKKVLVITYYWPPSGGAGVQRWLKFVKYLRDFGWEPYVVTVDASKASYAVTDASLEKEIPQGVNVYRTSTFEPFNIYKKVSKKEQIPFAGFANEAEPGLMQKTARFIRGNFFIPDARVGWNRYAFKKCAELIRSEKIDAVITTSPPHSTQLIGLKLKKKFGIPWIADLRDPWTGIYYYNKMYHTSLAKKLDAGYEKNVIAKADAVITVSDQVKRNFIELAGEEYSSKFRIIPNGFDEEDFSGRKVQPAENFLISYTGTLTDDYNLEGFISAFKKAAASGLPYRIRFTGSMPEMVAARLRSSLGDRVIIEKYASHHEIIGKMLESSALLLVIPDVPGNKGILTGKLFEYLASRKPVICAGPVDGDAAKILAECEAGRTFEPGDSGSIFNYLMELSEKWKKDKAMSISAEGYRAYSRSRLTERLAQIIEAIHAR